MLDTSCDTLIICSTPPSPCAGLSGVVSLPGDKSISHRMLILSSIAEGQSTIRGLLMAEDVIATMNALRAMEVVIHYDPVHKICQVQGVGLHGLRPASNPLDLQNAGTALRLLTGLLAGQCFDSCLTGDESLVKRPMRRITIPLTQMGRDLPYRIEAQLHYLFTLKELKII